MNLPVRPPSPQPKALTVQEQKNRIIGHVRAGTADIQNDNSGQLVIYTGLFRWADGSVREEEDPTVREEDDPRNPF